MSVTPARTVLSIAGSDPSGGAGIRVDLEAFAAGGVHGCAVIAAITAQNDRRVSGVFAVPAAFVAAQIESVFDDRAIDAVKIGMLANGETVRAVAAALIRLGARNIVVDPVLRASSGAPLLDEGGLRALQEVLLPIATVITPNAFEAGALAGTATPTSVAEMHGVARLLGGLGSSFVLVTGGHVQAAGECVDVLADRNGQTVELRVPRVPDDIRGTGCRLSSSIAADLALGFEAPEACARAQRYVAAAVFAASQLRASLDRAAEHGRDRRSLPSTTLGASSFTLRAPLGMTTPTSSMSSI